MDSVIHIINFNVDVVEIEEAIEDLNYDAIDIEIGIAPKPVIEFDEEEEG
ncbi:hypothetical protein LOQ48_04220 [Staphylococcus capitis]|nr:hypothetical protein [Staphylococcus capitis]EGS38345.1 hypothetical protein SEVCU116_0407 [Staphylococcus capitis VCU116]MED7775762.1 hypothetical protein [Staphylococcus capitis]